MTLKEAKDILKKEGFHLVLVSKVINQTGAIREFEKPEVCEAIKVANANKWTIGLSPIECDEREALLKEEYEKNHIKCGEPIPGTPLGAVEGKRLRWKDNNNTDKRPKEGNPALKEAASQFNDALLDEQGKKIKRLGKEISKLNSIIHDKNAVLSDVAEELRLSKIREKNLTEVCQKKVKEIEELRKELADKVVDKIDAQALKSAESALAWKEKVVTYKDMALAYYEKKINEKDEVIADLGNELAATKKELEAFKESYKRRIKEDSEHFEHIQKICNAGLQKWLIESEYLEKDKPFCSPVKDNHPTEDNPEEVEVDEILEYVRKALEKGHTVSIDYDKAEEGGDQSATIAECGKDIDDVFEEIKRLCQE